MQKPRINYGVHPIISYIHARRKEVVNFKFNKFVISSVKLFMFSLAALLNYGMYSYTVHVSACMYAVDHSYLIRIYS